MRQRHPLVDTTCRKEIPVSGDHRIYPARFQPGPDIQPDIERFSGRVRHPAHESHGMSPPFGGLCENRVCLPNEPGNYLCIHFSFSEIDGSAQPVEFDAIKVVTAARLAQDAKIVFADFRQRIVVSKICARGAELVWKWPLASEPWYELGLPFLFSRRFQK